MRRAFETLDCRSTVESVFVLFVAVTVHVVRSRLTRICAGAQLLVTATPPCCGTKATGRWSAGSAPRWFGVSTIEPNSCPPVCVDRIVIFSATDSPGRTREQARFDGDLRAGLCRRARRGS